MTIHDTPIRPEVITPVTVSGLSQPLVDVAGVLSLQGHPHHAKSLCEAAWILEHVATLPAVVEYLNLEK
jgi:hypothetical protein